MLQAFPELRFKGRGQLPEQRLLADEKTLSSLEVFIEIFFGRMGVQRHPPLVVVNKIPASIVPHSAKIN